MNDQVKIFLDDVRDPSWVYKTKNENWVIVRDYQSAIKQIKQYSGRTSLISFDHDLDCFVKEPHTIDLVDGKETLIRAEYRLHQFTGYDVLTWLENAIYYKLVHLPEKMLTHSRNPVGKRRMDQVIEKIYQNYGENNR